MQNWKKIEHWFRANKLSMSIKKTKYTLFHENSSKDDTLLRREILKQSFWEYCLTSTKVRGFI